MLVLHTVWAMVPKIADCGSVWVLVRGRLDGYPAEPHERTGHFRPRYLSHDLLRFRVARSPDSAVSDSVPGKEIFIKVF